MQNVHLLPTITRQTNSVYAYYLQLQDKQRVCTLITYNYKTNKQRVRILPRQLHDKQTGVHYLHSCTLITYNYKTNKQVLRILPTITETNKQFVHLLPTITGQTNSVYAYYLQLQDKQTVVYAYYLQLQGQTNPCVRL